MYLELNEEDHYIKKWDQVLITKTLLFPKNALTFLKVNTFKSIVDLLGFVASGCLMVSGVIFLNYLLSKGK